MHAIVIQRRLYARKIRLHNRDLVSPINKRIPCTARASRHFSTRSDGHGYIHTRHNCCPPEMSPYDLRGKIVNGPRSSSGNSPPVEFLRPNRIPAVPLHAHTHTLQYRKCRELVNNVGSDSTQKKSAHYRVGPNSVR